MLRHLDQPTNRRVSHVEEVRAGRGELRLVRHRRIKRQLERLYDLGDLLLLVFSESLQRRSVDARRQDVRLLRLRG